ncbi:hypothetical protein [Spirillospora sp. CA-294931]|uniref:hypothetical protein n=1 Tax=Spirillospora sp. CA-294931 TaxID=3240042 RepID=UPI003D8C4548
MSFEGAERRETPLGERPPDNQRAVFLDELGREIARVWPELRAERVRSADGLPTRLVVTRRDSVAREEVGCDFDAETGWWFIWLWGEEEPQRIGHVRAIPLVARSVASVMGLRTLAV